MFGDLELVKAWNGGDREAGATLIERHLDAVTRFFRTKAAAQADDLVQLTFLRCAEARMRFQGTSFRAFLFGIARNVLYEHYRHKARRGAEPDFTVTAIADLSPGISTAFFEREEQRVLALALQRLPLELQSLVELYYWEELGMDELAAVFEIPPGTVKSRLFRARKLLEEAIADVPVDEATQQSVARLLDDWATRVP